VWGGHLQVHSRRGLPWLTFLRFFDVFAGASELAAVGLGLEGELFLEALVSCSSASLCSVMATDEAPFDRFAASGIQCARWAGLRAGCFLSLGVAQSMCHGRDMATRWRPGSNREGPESTLDGGTAEFGVKGE